MTKRRRLLLVPLVLLGLLGVLLGALFVRGGQRVAARHTVAAAGLPAVADSAAVARGHHLALAFGCHDCHGADLGGKVMADAPPFRLVSSNLTPGRTGEALSPDLVERAVRHGVGADGRSLWVMPTSSYRHMSTADVQALAAYMASLPPVDRDNGSVVVRPLGRLLAGAGMAHPEVFVEPAPGPATTPTGADLGRYVVDVTCRHCHGADLTGAPHPDPDGMAAPSLAPASRWTPEQFAAALRTGRRPSGPQMDSTWMPWTAFRHLTDAEMTAVQGYLRETLANRL